VLFLLSSQLIGGHDCSPALIPAPVHMAQSSMPGRLNPAVSRAISPSETRTI
jgi:hypothetical protein